MERLPIIFRAERSGDFAGQVSAVFPTLPWSRDCELTTYAHIGQHGGGSLGWYRATRPATPAEYAPLLAELRAIYGSDPDPVELDVRQRMTPAINRARNKALAR
jgi:hypothetical protein